LTNTEGNLLIKLRTIDGLRDTIDNHQTSFSVTDAKRASKEVFSEPSKFDIMMADSISESISTDKFDGSLVIFEESKEKSSFKILPMLAVGSTGT